jgi:hypothetical protein
LNSLHQVRATAPVVTRDRDANSGLPFAGVSFGGIAARGKSM